MSAALVDATAPRIPLLVLGGFLGAGKTTLLNHLLSQRDAQGQALRWLALVNDFGEINLDAELIAQQHADTMALTNGCVCCSIGGDLSQALIQALDRRPLPEAIVIEASGVSDPWRVAQIGMAAHEIVLDGVVVVVDAASALAHAADPMLSDTLTRPLAHADLVVTNKTDLVNEAQMALLDAWLDTHAPRARRFATTQSQVPLELLSSAALQPVSAAAHESAQAHHHHETCGHDEHDHAHSHHDQQFVTWQAHPESVLDEAQLAARIHALPRHILRIKGVVQTERGWRELQFAGTKVRFRHATPAARAQLVGIGLRQTANDNPFDALLA